MRTRDRWLGYVLCLWLVSCGTNHMAVTMQTFQEVSVGATVSEVVELMGKPYAVHERSDGTVEYEYVERISAGVRNFEDRHYFLVFKDGRVVSRRVKASSPPPYRFDSYDMQTTQSQGLCP